MLLDRFESPDAEILGTRSDEEVLALSVRSPKFFSIIVERYQGLFLRKTRPIVGGGEEDACDIVQDTFVKIYLNADRYKKIPGASFKSWAYKILLNTCFSWCKKKKRERHFFASLDEELLEFVPDARAAEKWEDRLDREYLISLMSALPEKLGRMLRLHYLEGKPHREIARIEGVRENAIRTRVHRAKKALHKIHLTMVRQ